MMKKDKSKKISISEKILELSNFLKSPRFATEIRKEIKDRYGYSTELQDVRVNLLYLLRRRKIKRKKKGTEKYKYFL